MIEKYYNKIARPLTIIFACLGFLVTIDYFMPREIYTAAIDVITVDMEYHPRYSRRPTYSIEIGNQTIRINNETYGKLNIGDRVEVQKTKILRKITRLKDNSQPEKKINIYVAPFTYFPLFAIIFLLPVAFEFIKGDSMLLMSARPFSLVIALASLLMVVF
jgi:hypothetical protein